ncbi:MAG: hypothetical protein IPK17_30255 [Chloroflexi bacterium]|uniref:hypothetical protein n=1 Tax=Candidatus Flexifilum breve TaxID=3140694 RepID=UPI003134B302|nr:hypothetical protein [Chloroflexota bacterium]
MRFARMPHLSLTITLVLLWICTGTLAAQDVPELEAVATISDAVGTLSINYPEDWVTFSSEEALYVANAPAMLDASLERSGSVKRGATGVILFAPGTAATLDLPEASSAADALAAFLERQGLRSPSGEVYDGDPAISFGLFPVQANGELDFGIPFIEGASVDAFAFEREGTFIFVLLISTDDVFALSEAMWDTLTLTSGDAVPESEETVAEGDFVLPVDDNGRQFAFSATLPEGWEALWDEETGVLVLASSGAALDVATGASDDYERGDSALIVTLPPGLRALEINPFDSADLVFTAYAATLEIEAYPAFVEGFEVFTAQAYIAGESLPGGQASLYAFGFPAGVVTVMVQDVLGASNPDVNDVLHSLQYDLPE